VRLVEWQEGTSRLFRLDAATEAAVNELDTVGWMLRSNALWAAPEPETFAGDIFALEGTDA
jgi:hypothetical protein